VLYILVDGIFIVRIGYQKHQNYSNTLSLPQPELFSLLSHAAILMAVLFPIFEANDIEVSNNLAFFYVIRVYSSHYEHFRSKRLFWAFLLTAVGAASTQWMGISIPSISLEAKRVSNWLQWLASCMLYVFIDLHMTPIHEEAGHVQQT